MFLPAFHAWCCIIWKLIGWKEELNCGWVWFEDGKVRNNVVSIVEEKGHRLKGQPLGNKESIDAC